MFQSKLKSSQQRACWEKRIVQIKKETECEPEMDLDSKVMKGQISSRMFISLSLSLFFTTVASL